MDQSLESSPGISQTTADRPVRDRDQVSRTPIELGPNARVQGGVGARRAEPAMTSSHPRPVTGSARLHRAVIVADRNNREREANGILWTSPRRGGASHIPGSGEEFRVPFPCRSEATP